MEQTQETQETPETPETPEILNKLSKLEDTNSNWDNWNVREKKQLLDIYLQLCKKESQIFDLIYSYHGCDSWEDIFRDYDMEYCKDKISGIEVAIERMNE